MVPKGPFGPFLKGAMFFKRTKETEYHICSCRGAAKPKFSESAPGLVYQPLYQFKSQKVYLTLATLAWGTNIIQFM